MTATHPAIQVITSATDGASGCPSWCREHLSSPPGSLLHRCDLGRPWGATEQPYDEEKVFVALERHDDEGVAGEPYLSLRYSEDGRWVDQVVNLPLRAAEQMLLAALGLVAQGRNDRQFPLESVA